MQSGAYRVLGWRLQSDEGFTIIELMFVVMIIGILIAMAIPTFLGVRTRVRDTSAESSGRNAVLNARILFLDKADYGTVDSTAMANADPSLSFKAPGTASTASKEVSVNGGTTPSKVWYAAVMSASNTCWFIRDSEDPTNAAPAGVRWAKSTTKPCKTDNTGASGIAVASWAPGTP